MRLFLVTLLSLYLVSAVRAEAKDRPPNFVIVYADDKD